MLLPDGHGAEGAVITECSPTLGQLSRNPWLTFLTSIIPSFSHSRSTSLIFVANIALNYRDEFYNLGVC